MAIAHVDQTEERKALNFEGARTKFHLIGRAVDALGDTDQEDFVKTYDLPREKWIRIVEEQGKADDVWIKKTRYACGVQRILNLSILRLSGHDHATIAQSVDLMTTTEIVYKSTEDMIKAFDHMKATMLSTLSYLGRGGESTGVK